MYSCSMPLHSDTVTPPGRQDCRHQKCNTRCCRVRPAHVPIIYSGPIDQTYWGMTDLIDRVNEKPTLLRDYVRVTTGNITELPVFSSFVTSVSS